MSIKKNKNKLIIAALAGLIVTLLAYQSFSSMQAQINLQKTEIEKLKQGGLSDVDSKSYVVVIRDIVKGEKIKEEDIQVKQFPMKIEGGINKKSDCLGLSIKNDIKINGVLTASMFDKKIGKGKNALRKGYRPMSVPYGSLSGMSPYIKEGNFVDIYSTSQNMPYSLEAIKILSFDKDSGGGGIKTVTFEIPNYEVPFFIDAMSSAKFLLVARGQDEKPTDDDGKKLKQEYYNSSKMPQTSDSLPPPMEIGGGLDMKPIKRAQTVEIIRAENKSQMVFE